MVFFYVAKLNKCNYRFYYQSQQFEENNLLLVTFTKAIN